jgi:phthalate 4,5-dioxygenase
MTSQRENDLLTNVGPGTPMGTLMRQYWLPACLSSELTADGDPVRLMLLGERLIAFRGTPAEERWLDAYEQTRAQAVHPGFAEEAD